MDRAAHPLVAARLQISTSGAQVSGEELKDRTTLSPEGRKSSHVRRMTAKNVEN